MTGVADGPLDGAELLNPLREGYPVSSGANRRRGVGSHVGEALALLDRLLPTPGDAPPEPGHMLPEQPWWQRLVTTLDRSAAVYHHEIDDEILRR
ncbi:hypothetical protein [Actinomycetospora chibensis]|uniref:Uncharacterized protein n=1 Tax=Actinomycetospora chibensis TaxID=663606 RepID=A0ABV9RR26_9PSEU|nr:hypothetical protein [Actinomycetospora chibensis]MDD7923102.1 hypothetical protein [Actinomycetospora chibensis]